MGATSSSPPTPALPSSRTVIVTGGNTGIGYETAKAIAQMGARVIIACRSEERAKEAIEKMQREYKISNTGNKDPASAAEAKKKQEKDGELASSHQLLVEYMHLDLSSLSSTVDFVKAFKQTGYLLHVLICNAGIAFVNQALTGDGFETHFQVNYLSHLLLVLNLLPVMKQSVPDVRVVFVSSQMEKWAGDFNLDNIQGQQSYDRTKFYSNSKLYMVMAMYYLHRCLASKEITFCALHPGVVSTEITRSFQDFTSMNLGFRIYKALGMSRTPQEGAKTTINCAVYPELAGVSGAYYIDCRSTQPSQLARDEKKQEKLWKYSIECLKGFIDENILSEFGLTVTSLEDKKLSAD